MFQIRRGQDRGHFDHGWLNTYHTFSFADYRDPNQMGFRSLRVINEDRVAPSQGFGTHPHRDMEILSYVLSGSLQHKDNLGNGSVIKPGELQLISAGTGVTHSEFNPSPDDMVHFYQIWLFPQEKGLSPSYQQRAFPIQEQPDKWHLIAGREGPANSIILHQDTEIYLAALSPGKLLGYELSPDRFAWLQIVAGTVLVNGEKLNSGDGVAMGAVEKIGIDAREKSEVMLFDLN